MVQEPTFKRFLPVAALLATGGLFFFSTGLTGIRPLVLVAPVPVLLIAQRVSRRAATLLAFLASCVGGLNLVGYLSRLAPTTFVVLSILLPALAFALVVVAFRDAILHLRHPMAFLAFPVGWTAYEFLLSTFSPHGTAGSIAYTQADVLPLIQIASLTGIQGMTFVITLVPAGIAAGMLTRDRRHFLAIFLVVLIVGFGSLVYGWIRLSSDRSGESIRVGLVANDSTVRYYESTDREIALQSLHSYLRAASVLAARGASIIVLPEKIVGVTEAYDREILDSLSAFARNEHVAIVAGLNRIGVYPHRNYAVALSADGSIQGEYDKAYPIPGLETGYQTGTRIFTPTIAGISSGIAICKDMDFPEWIRNYGAARTQMMIVPAWDFSVDAWLHSRMAILRSAENGFAMVRAANNGYLTVADDAGRVVGEAASSDRSPVMLVCDVHPGTGRTFYAGAGNWFAWVNLAALLVLLVAVSRRLARRFSTHPS